MAGVGGRGGRASASGVAVLALLACGTASAQPYGYAPRAYADPYAQPAPYPEPSPYAYGRPGPGYGDPSYGQNRCCAVPAGTEVAVALVKPVGTEHAHAGDEFELRLAAPLIVDGQVVLAAGAPGVGHVVQSSGPGIGGKGAKLVVSADYLTTQDGRIALQGMQLTGAGQDHSRAADLLGLGGLVFMPLGFAGILVTGGEIEIPAGTAAAAKTAEPAFLAPIAQARDEDYRQVQAVFGQSEQSRGWIAVPPPPRGLGQVVFFRPKALGDFQWFNVRENGEALGKLTSGTYFILPLRPGVHSFTAKSEPELKDHLTLKVDPGETYYVEATMTHGLVLGAAELTPSEKARFDKVSGELKPAEQVRTADSRP